MARIASSVAHFKRDPATLLSQALIVDACGEAAHAWRDRLLGPVILVRLMVWQMLLGNVSCRRLKRVAGFTAGVNAYLQARMTLPIDVLLGVLRRVNEVAWQHIAGAGEHIPTWRGHRVLILDGSGVSMPDTPALQSEFGQPGRCRPGCGFPVMHTLWLFDFRTGLLIDYVTSRWNTHDLARAAALHPMMWAGDVLLGDRPRK